MGRYIGSGYRAHMAAITDLGAASRISPTPQRSAAAALITAAPGMRSLPVMQSSLPNCPLWESGWREGRKLAIIRSVIPAIG